MDLKNLYTITVPEEQYLALFQSSFKENINFILSITFEQSIIEWE